MEGRATEESCSRTPREEQKGVRSFTLFVRANRTVVVGSQPPPPVTTRVLMAEEAVTRLRATVHFAAGIGQDEPTLSSRFDTISIACQ